MQHCKDVSLNLLTSTGHASVFLEARFSVLQASVPDGLHHSFRFCMRGDTLLSKGLLSTAPTMAGFPRFSLINLIV